MASSRSSKGKGTTGSSREGFLKPLNPSAALAEIVGHEPLPRTEVTKRVWDYIREHNLQDPSDKRMILADPKLRAIFHGKTCISMFELTKFVNSHLAGTAIIKP